MWTHLIWSSLPAHPSSARLDLLSEWRWTPHALLTGAEMPLDWRGSIRQHASELQSCNVHVSVAYRHFTHTHTHKHTHTHTPPLSVRLHICTAVYVYTHQCMCVPTHAQNESLNSACMCVWGELVLVCVSGWESQRERERERERECVGGIRFDKVPHFSEIITCSRYRDRVVWLRGCWGGNEKKKKLSLSLSLLLSLALSRSRCIRPLSLWPLTRGCGCHWRRRG